MARRGAVVHAYSFNKGLVTDASPLAWPENTCSELSNFRLEVDGSITVRKGLALEANNDATKNTTVTYSHVVGASWFRWNRALPELDVVVIKYGNTLYFHTIDPDGVMTASSINQTLSLTTISGATANDVAITPVSMASTAGYLVVVGKYIDAHYIKLTAGTYVPVATEITVQERDFEGRPPLPLADEPSSLTFDHAYNLLNQGWTGHLIGVYNGVSGRYPALSTAHIYGYRNSLSTGNEFWDPALAANNSTATSRIPRGHVILNALDATVSTSRLVSATLSAITSMVYTPGTPGSLAITVPLDLTGSLNIGDFIRVSANISARFGSPTNPIIVQSLYDYGNLEITNITSTVVTVEITLVSGALAYDSGFSYTYAGGDSLRPATVGSETQVRAAETYRFENTCVWAGRVWYAGIDSPTIGNRIYFSQVFEGPSRFGLCFQEADPTSRNISEVVATDGGVIIMNEMGKCIALMPLLNQLIVFTTNGVWAVFGRDGIFDATAYSVRKLSEEVLVSKLAVAKTDAGVVFWSATGLSLIGETEGGGMGVRSLTDGVLKNLITEYGPLDWPYIRGSNFEGNKAVGFILPNSDRTANNRILWLDFRLGAFYVDDFKTNADVSLVSILYQHDASTDARVKVLAVADQLNTNTYKMACYEYTHADTDFANVTNLTEELDAVAITGYTTGGDATKAKQGTYLHVYMEQDSDASAYMSTIWDFAANASSNKYSNRQQCFINKPNFLVSASKLRVRGWGQALQVKFENERGKPCKIRGWDIEVEANSAS